MQKVGNIQSLSIAQLGVSPHCDKKEDIKLHIWMKLLKIAFQGMIGL